ncbi:MAG: 4'-phosphopantetheinyl transferase superfamily protein [bacterium]|nr:4'-phosphopantetheinyl transferase superfamily protein [bacterium]
MVDLWAVDLRPPTDRVEELRRLLTRDEAERAGRFKFDRHRRRFIVRRAALRILAGGYLCRDPAALRFGEGEKGKPFVTESAEGAGGFHFNLSDSRDLAVYAFTRGAELGVDVEILRPIPDAQQIAEHFFSVEEREVLRTVREERKSDAFFNCWTRKEAYIKAIGEGLSEPLDRFSVTLLPEEPARFLHLGGDRRRAASWTLHHLVPEAGSVGALALEGEGWQIAGCHRLLLDD